MDQTHFLSFRFIHLLVDPCFITVLCVPYIVIKGLPNVHEAQQCLHAMQHYIYSLTSPPHTGNGTLAASKNCRILKQHNTSIIYNSGNFDAEFKEIHAMQVTVVSIHGGNWITS